ncbi:GroES-like protein [Wallemia mellicola]|uniref:GroES-like protein n=1 Tax=Wallemia mellicola TaxID=1708541 RepID=A0A4T0M4W4_9BASI|nr:hypothetical protein E3Q23_02720 [Wallemia mellicola]TIB77648.1 GroES-like protein [Wallemia mellicola]TIB98992.1 GroES-like protein [Wallemia mellicola]TIC10444.1 GroES-like protein [Wallemia mellicola]TIC10967.1 GroES-like protein [Wallemia mellicola]
MHITENRDALVNVEDANSASKALIIESKHTYKLTSEWKQPKLNGNPHNVKVRIIAAGLNTIDYKSVDYNFNLPQYPWTLGREASGIVIEAGAEASKTLSVGDRVWVSTYYKYIDGGVFQEYIVVPSHTVIKIPSTITYDKAATLGVTALTASMTLHHYFNISIDANTPDSLLVWGASTVTAQFIIQLAVRSGMNVYGVASETNLKLVESLGAIPISRSNKTYDEIVDEVNAVSNNSIKYVADLIGIESSNAALRLLKRGGVIAPLASMTLGKDAKIPDGVDVKIIEMKRFILDSSYKWHADYLNKLIQANELVFPAIEILNGFESIQKGLDRLKQGNMNGKKLVVLF